MSSSTDKQSSNITPVCRAVSKPLSSARAGEAYLWIKCKPLAVSTIPLIPSFGSAKAASSNSFCISPLPKYPRSPLLRAEEQSDSVSASSPSVESPSWIFFCHFSMVCRASSLERVISAYNHQPFHSSPRMCPGEQTSLQLLGRRLSACLINKCAALIFPSEPSPAEGGGCVPALWLTAM